MASNKIKAFLWFTLFDLLRQGAVGKFVRISTTELSRITGLSQQSASRHLKLLEKEGLISRHTSFEGTRIMITSDGVKRLEEVFYILQSRLEEVKCEAFEFVGTVFSGMYQGGYYITQEGYRDQLVDKLGFDPYPGTLNVRLREADLELRRNLERLPGVKIEGFRSANRAFGGARCYPLLVNGEVEGALITADRTSYDLSVMEIIAPISLRDRFGLEDGDTVRLSISDPLRSSS
jgi:riboflavin kinase